MSGELERLAMIAIVALVYAPLELLWPAARRPIFSWRRYRTDFLHILFSGAVIRFGTAAALTLSLLLFDIPPIGREWPLWVQIVAVLLISDFMFYAAHRLYHSVPFLWEFHKIHHSSDHLDWLATYRVHPLDQIVNTTAIALPALILGFSPLALLVYAAVYQWHAVLLHSNIRAHFGVLGRLIVSPRFHRWHHANEKEAYNRNFGGQLAIWDRLLGTHYEPSREPTAFGLADPPVESFLAHIVVPFYPGRPMANYIRFFERLFLVLLSVGVIMRLAPVIPYQPQVALFLFSELVGVALILFQRRGEWTVEPYPIAIAFLGTAAGLLIVPDGLNLASVAVSTVLVVIGSAIVLFAKLSLGRSFGIIPANRGVKARGAYRFVRHPMYFGYMVNQLGFLLLYFSVWNVAVYTVAWLALWLRTVEEEKFLGLDPAYRDYSAKVRYRLVPGVI